MGQIVLPRKGSVYMDANCFVYSVEHIEPYYTILDTVWQSVNSGNLTIVTSEMTLLEVLVKPIKMKATNTVAAFRSVLHRQPQVRMMPITQLVLEEAATLRATTSLKTPDAIHMATALLSSCTLLLTNDAAFRQMASIPVQMLDDVNLQEDSTEKSS